MTGADRRAERQSARAFSAGYARAEARAEPSHSGCDHWTECDRPTCMNAGRRHVDAAGHEHPLWLCSFHADQQEGAER